MSSKGENKRSKAVSAPRTVFIARKEHKWTVRTKAGPHTKNTSMALGLIIRNFAAVAVTMKESKRILNHGEVKVNGVVRKDHQFAVGLFDVVSIDRQKLHYRVVLDDKERLVLKATDAEKKDKVSKVTKKIMTSKGIQLTTDDGRTFMGIKADVEDSLKIKLPEGKSEKVLEFAEGALVYVMKGAHCAEIATVKEIISGTSKREELVKLARGKEEFETISGNVIVIGKGKSEMADLE